MISFGKIKPKIQWTLSPKGCTKKGQGYSPTLPTVLWEMVRQPYFTPHFLFCHTLRILRRRKREVRIAQLQSPTSTSQTRHGRGLMGVLDKGLCFL